MGLVSTFGMNVSDKPLSSTSKIVLDSQEMVPGKGKSIPSFPEKVQKFNIKDCKPLPSTSEEYQGISPGDADPIPSTSEESQRFVQVDDRPLPYNYEEYHTYIPGIGDSFPYSRDKAEFRLIYVIPKSLLLEETNCEGVIIQPDKKFQMEDDVEEFTRYFTLKCYPNGDCKENEGYISLIFEENIEEMFIQLSKLNVTLTLLDADKNHRFPQSLTLDHDDMYLNPCNVTFGLSRYIKRDALLSSDLFCADKLLIQCEAQFYMIDNVLHEAEPPFVRTESYDETGHHISIVLVVNHLLWTILCEKSPYFHKIIVTDGNTEIPIFDEMEYQAFDVIVKCIMSGTDPRMHDLSIQKVFTLYEYADYVLLTEFKEICNTIIKERITAKIACNVIAMSDMHSDADLKKFAIQYAVDNWRKVIASKSWNILNKERPDLVKEINECKAAEDGPRKKKMKTVIETDTEYLQQFQYYQ